jgi:hypothetical protein
MYSGTVSIGDAVQAIERSMYTWATVKLYYATFYLARALLALNGTGLIYDGTKPYSWDGLPGAIPTKRDGPTHKVVLNTFSAILPKNPLLSQPINSIGALQWLMQRREEANYANARFSEPNAPKHFTLIAQEGVRRVISAYVRDDTFLYAFDPQHAILALPIEALKQVIKRSLAGGSSTTMNPDDRKYLAGLYFDKAGPLADIAALLK